MNYKRKVKIRIASYSSILILIVLINVFVPYIAPYNPNEVVMSQKLQTPNSAHLLGTDNLGRDILSRVIYGGRSSILIAAAATSLSMTLGLIIGLASGYFGGILDSIITIISNIFQGLPGMTLMIALVGILGADNKSLVFSLVITSWVGFSRFVRAEVMRTKQETYIEGMKCFGASHLRIIIKGIIPNILSNCLILFTTRIGRVVLSVSGLSYLGLGIQPPTPDWGAMISEAQKYFRTTPHLLIAPGICIIIFSLAVNLLGDAMRDYMDVKNDSIKEF